MRAATADASKGPFRPVQFLGSKLRVLGAIDEALGKHGPSVIWEPFVGSTVVSQRLAARGHKVIAGDALTASATFARALLGVGRTDSSDEHLAVGSVLTRALSLPLGGDWEPWIAAETAAIKAGDGLTLLRLGQDLPQQWRTQGGALGLLSSTDDLLSNIYAGTYFGLNQALRLQRLRKAVDLVGDEGGLSAWCRDVALTALCTAASRAVFSAGKHFAQPHHVSGLKNLTFHSKRVLSDRAVDVEQVFEAALNDIICAARPGSEGHLAETRRVEQSDAAWLRSRGVTAVYADPPYTAQQYSRFYHLLETLVQGAPPELQLVNGEVTRGLYPTGRYLSPFCSRRAAPDAFTQLLGCASDAGARLLLSYSASASGAAGNARTVELDELVGLVEAAYGLGRAEILQVNLRYRQFNRASHAKPDRDDREFLILADARAK